MSFGWGSSSVECLLSMHEAMIWGPRSQKASNGHKGKMRKFKVILVTQQVQGQLGLHKTLFHNQVLCEHLSSSMREGDQQAGLLSSSLVQGYMVKLSQKTKQLQTNLFRIFFTQLYPQCVQKSFSLFYNNTRNQYIFVFLLLLNIFHMPVVWIFLP